MTGLAEKKYCVVSQINLHKSKTCNDDAALFFKYLSRHFYLDEFDRPKGLEPFATSFKYKLSMEFGPDYGIVDPLLLADAADAPAHPQPDGDDNADPADNSANSGLDGSIGSFHSTGDNNTPVVDPAEIKRQNSLFQTELRNFLKKARNGAVQINNPSQNVSSASSNLQGSPTSNNGSWSQGSIPNQSTPKNHSSGPLANSSNLSFGSHTSTLSDISVIPNKKVKLQNPPKAFIYAVFEPNYSNNRMTGLEGGKNLVVIDRSKNGPNPADWPRAALIASSSANAWEVSKFTNRDMATLRLIDESGKYEAIYITAVYMDSLDKSVVNASLKALTKHCQQENAQLLILSDCNSHSTLFGMPTTNARGRVLEYFIAKSNLKVLNRGKEVTFHREGVGSIIDISLASPDLANDVSFWSIVNGVPSSDHLAAFMTISLDICKPQYKWDLNRTDWDKLFGSMETSCSKEYDPIEVIKYWREINPQHSSNTTHNASKDSNESLLAELRQMGEDEWNWAKTQYETFMFEENLWEAVKISTPKVLVTPNMPKKLWYNSDLKAMAVKLKYINNACRRTRNDKSTKGHKSKFTHSDWVAHRKAYQKACRKASSEYWRNFLEASDTPKDVSSLKKIINKNLANNLQLGLLSDEQGELLTPQDSMNLMADTHFIGSIPLDASTRLRRPKDDHNGTTMNATPSTIHNGSSRGTSFQSSSSKKSQKSRKGLEKRPYLLPPRVTKKKSPTPKHYFHPPDIGDPNEPGVNINDPKVDFINEDRVKFAINSFKPIKAPGVDGIVPKILQKGLGPIAIGKLTKIFKACALIGKCPDAWLENKVIFLAKPGKEDYTKPKSWRPISLMPFLFKSFEKLWLWHIEETTLKTHPLSENQHGFRRGRSTETCLTVIFQRIEYSLLKNDYVLGALLDLVGAYNEVSYEIIEKTLIEKEVNPLFITFYMSYLRNRTITLEHKGVLVHRKCTRGVAQGSVLSPVIFALVGDALLRLFEYDMGEIPIYDSQGRSVCQGRVRRQPNRPVIRDKVYVSGFADDTTFYICGKSLPALQAQMQIVLDFAQDWAKSAGMQFSPDKTQIIIFTRKRQYEEPKKLQIAGKPIKYSKVVKYLGIYMDSKLNMRYHLIETLKTSKKLLFSLQKTNGKKFGTSPWSTSYYYKAIVRAKVGYGGLVWHPVCRHRGIQEKMKQFQRLGLTPSGPIWGSTPTRGLEIITYLRPLELELRKQAAEAYMRTMDFQIINPNQMWTEVESHKGHRQWSQEFLQIIGFKYQGCPIDRIPLEFKWNKSYKVDYASLKSDDPQIRGQVRYDAPIRIFTDGSSHPHTPSGSGVVMDWAGEPKKFSYNVGNVDIMEAEIYALKKAAQIIINNYDITQGENVTIYCDSMAAIYSIDAKTTTSYNHSRAIHALNGAGRICNLTIRWVKSHSKSVGNANADFAANKGRTLPYVIHDAPRITWAQVTTEMVTKVNILWALLFALEPTCRQTKQWFPKPDPKRSFKIMKLKRLQWGKLVQFITGHNTLNRHLFLTGVDPEISETCTLCGYDPMTSSHVMGSCPALMWKRGEVFNEYFLDTPFTAPIGKVLHFMKMSGLEPIKWDD